MSAAGRVLCRGVKAEDGKGLDINHYQNDYPCLRLWTENRYVPSNALPIGRGAEYELFSNSLAQGCFANLGAKATRSSDVKAGQEVM